MKQISVVMATYNGAKYLRPQLESLARQSTPPAELIISDDDSTDNTYQIATDFAQRAPFPTIVMRNDRRAGYIENFLGASKHARFDYIAFCDQDDIWHPRKLETCLAALSQSNAVLCTHTANLINEEGHQIGVFSQGIVKDQIFPPLTLEPWLVFHGFTEVFDARLLQLIPDEMRGIDNYTLKGLVSHDRWIYFLASCFGNVVTLSSPLVDYRQHQANLYGGKPKNIAQKIRGMLTETSLGHLQHRDMAHHRANILLHLAQENKQSNFCNLAKQASEYWSRLSDLYELRAQLYASDELFTRLNLFRRLMATGAYRHYSRGGLNYTKIPKDILLGVFRQAKKT